MFGSTASSDFFWFSRVKCRSKTVERLWNLFWRNDNRTHCLTPEWFSSTQLHYLRKFAPLTCLLLFAVGIELSFGKIFAMFTVLLHLTGWLLLPFFTCRRRGVVELMSHRTQEDYFNSQDYWRSLFCAYPKWSHREWDSRFHHESEHHARRAQIT